MSALTDRLSEDDLRELARLIRVIHADAEAWRERERLERERLERERLEAEASESAGDAGDGSA